MVAGYLDISGGEILFSGTKMGTGTRAERLAYRDKVQMVFQDPASSLNPRQTLEQIIGLPLHLRGMTNAAERRDTVADLLDQVHLPRSFIHRRPTSLSGVQKQLGVVRNIADRVAVLYHGDIVETGPAESLFSNPQTDYARTLIAAVPRATAN